MAKPPEIDEKKRRLRFGGEYEYLQDELLKSLGRSTADATLRCLYLKHKRGEKHG
jgi:hypothetical protein